MISKNPNQFQHLDHKETRFMHAHQEDEKLDYPLVQNPEHPTSGEYLIPDSDKKKVLEKMDIFEGIPDLKSKLYDLHEGLLFVVKDFKVVREDGKNYLVSPYYYRSGGTVIDWMPESWASEMAEEADC